MRWLYLCVYADLEGGGGGEGFRGGGGGLRVGQLYHKWKEIQFLVWIGVQSLSWNLQSSRWAGMHLAYSFNIGGASVFLPVAYQIWSSIMRWPAWKLDLQPGQYFENSVQSTALISKFFKSCLKTSLNLSCGLPVRRVTFSSTPCICGSKIFALTHFIYSHVSPNIVRRIWVWRRSGPEPVILKNSSLAIFSCQVLPNMSCSQ